MATIGNHLALSMSVTASSANNIGSESLHTDELKTHIAGNWKLQTNVGLGGGGVGGVVCVWGGGGTHSCWQDDCKGLKRRKPVSDHSRHALHFRPDSSDKTLVMHSPM